MGGLGHRLWLPRTLRAACRHPFFSFWPSRHLVDILRAWGADTRPSARERMFLSRFLQRRPPDMISIMAPGAVIIDCRCGDTKGLLSGASAAGRRRESCLPELGGDDCLSCRSRLDKAHGSCGAP